MNPSAVQPNTSQNVEDDPRPARPVPSNHRWALLGAVRFLLALIVMTGHLNDIYPNTFRIFGLAKLGGGGDAVICFFAISGFSIAHSVLTEPNEFVKRRFHRLYPVYLFALVIALLGSGISVIPKPSSLFEIVANFFFLQGVCAQAIGVLPSWTLSCEMQYYLAAPFLQKHSTKFGYVGLAISSVLYLLRDRFGIGSFVNQEYDISMFLLFWAWILGYTFYADIDKWFTPVLYFGVGSLLVMQYVHPMPPYAPALWIITGIIMMFGSVNISKPLAKFLLFLGDLSWPMYILHPTFFRLELHWIHNKSGLFYIASMLVYATAVYYCVDLPARRWLKKRYQHRLMPHTN